MQIALTKKLADAMGVKPAILYAADPLFSWTANWVRVWENRKAENMLVLVNNATRFVVAAYEVRRKDLKKNMPCMMSEAIKNTMLTLNLNPEIVDAYMRLAGEVEFAVNRDSQFTAWVNKAGIECSFYIGQKYNGIDKMFNDTVGANINHRLVGYSKNYEDSFRPKERFFGALSALTGLPIYSYRAFELLVTLDLEIHKATRRLIVSSEIELSALHDALQSVFQWEDYHLHDWCVFNGKSQEPAVRLVMSDEDLAYDDTAILENKHKLSEYLPRYSHIVYTYDMGDNWEHRIDLVRIIDDHRDESPYLCEAVGKTPPEDVGGVGGYINFCKIMLDPDCEEYAETRKWVGYWQPELNEWEQRPHVIHGW